jgi:RsiW-degrading membrane proteinase PrsW (M82 family)
VRTVLSPARHGAWTGLICAMLWRARERPTFAARRCVPLAFLVAVLLHALWDGFDHPWQRAIVAAVSLTLLLWRVQAADVPAAQAPGRFSRAGTERRARWRPTA